jgi:hypothetical protein
MYGLGAPCFRGNSGRIPIVAAWNPSDECPMNAKLRKLNTKFLTDP